MTDDLTVAPWRTTDSRLAYCHRPVALFEDQTLDPADAPGLRHRLLEPDSTRVIAVDGDGQLALVGHWRYPLAAVQAQAPGRRSPHLQAAPTTSGNRTGPGRSAHRTRRGYRIGP